MEYILQEIKTSLSTCTPDELQARIPVWRDQFRQQGISITALETLLNFFLEPHPAGASGGDEAFVDPHFNEDPKGIRTKAGKLERENSELRRQVAKWRTNFYVALAVLALCISACAAFFLSIK